MLTEISYYQINGRPLIFYLGLLTITSLLITASLGFIHFKGYARFPFIWHPVMAGISIILALIHGVLGFLAYI